MRRLLLSLLAATAACGGGVPILMYHSVLPAGSGDPLAVTPQQLDAQLDYFKQAGFTTVSLRQMIDAEDGHGSLPPHPIVLSFDDGFEESYRTTLPMLQKRGQKATFFVVSGFTAPDAAHRVHDRRSKRPYLVWNEVRALHAAGMEIGSHTVTHGKLTELTPSALWHEVLQSRLDLQTGLGAPVDFFSYPFTAQRFRVRNVVVHAGYSAAVVGPRGGADRFALQRITIHARTTLDDLKSLLSESWATGYTTGGG